MVRVKNNIENLMTHTLEAVNEHIDIYGVDPEDLKMSRMNGIGRVAGEHVSSYMEDYAIIEDQDLSFVGHDDIEMEMYG